MATMLKSIFQVKKMKIIWNYPLWTNIESLELCEEPHTTIISKLKILKVIQKKHLPFEFPLFSVTCVSYNLHNLNLLCLFCHLFVGFGCSF
jgi:hypothetical protein